LVKQISFTMQNWFYETYLQQFAGNRSALICGLIARGFDYETSGQDTRNAIIVRVEQENRELRAKVKKLEFELTKYSHRKPGISEEARNNMRIVKGLIKSGWNERNAP